MLTNYLKIAFRNLLKNKTFSLINLLGLAIGMAVCLLMLQYITFEWSYDGFHEKADQIYRVKATYHEGATRESLLTPRLLGPELQKNYPEVVNFTRLMLPWSGQEASSTLSWENPDGKLVKQNFQWGFYTDPGFLDMFSFQWLQGYRNTALEGANKIVLSESTARKLFGNNWQEKDDLIGRTVEYLNEYDRFQLVVTGIMADAPEHSHFQYDFLASFATLSTGWAKEFLDTWEGNGTYTYLQLEPGTDAQSFVPKMKELLATQAPKELQSTIDFDVQPLRDIHLHSHLEEELKVNGNPTYVSFLSLIAAIILTVALLNYVSLNTAKAVARGNEVGVRKVIGARRTQLIRQFLYESVLMNAIAFILAITLVQVTAPLYVQLTGKALVFNHNTLLWLIILFPVSTLLSGLYPAFVLSGYHPLQALKGKLMYSPQGKNIRKGMVVFQFMVSMMLITFTFAVVWQLHHMQSSDPGFNRNGVLVVKGPGNRTETWIEHDRQRNANDQADLFKDAVSQFAGVAAISLSWSVPGEQNSIWPIGLGEAYQYGKLDVITSDNDFAAVYGLELLAGEFDTDHGYVINERAAKVLGYADPTAAVGQTFKDARNDERNIRGVIRDYHHQSFQYEIRPVIFVQNDPTYKLDAYYSIKVGAKNLQSTLDQIRKAYKNAYPYDSFDYYFIDRYFDAQYREDIRLGKLFGFFSGITIFIACLGLFGLSLHAVVEKTKEIGIRKVLGASVGQIVQLLSQDFMKLILLASLMAIPVAWLATKEWLTNYATRIQLNGWLFALPLVLILILALCTISFQTIRAALTNPVKSLRNE